MSNACGGAEGRQNDTAPSAWPSAPRGRTASDTVIRTSERSIHEMLKDTPPLRESSDSITSGTEAKFTTSRSMPFPPAYAPPDVSQNGTANTLLRAGASKVDSLRNWGLSTYKCTKQLLYEKLGKSSRTVDTELEAQIEMLRETQRKYAWVLRLSTQLANQLTAALSTQRGLGEAFAELAQRSPELQQEFLYNADTQRSLTRNGDVLLAALHFFNNSLNTLCNKTIEDTLLTVRQYESARVEYDAYRSELEASGGNPPELVLANIERHRRHYERLRDDVAVKLRLLHENRVKVMHKQLLLFHNAVSAYFSGNNAALEAAVRHFNVHMPTASAPAPAPAIAIASASANANTPSSETPHT
ncbi:Arfaptin-1 [Eumeta japonica]|uniref:Arfaptin-1 n=1 Tax=Eumeta variegata TaxID=151549 RepID=A0A4C1Y2N0_EUMVA|nr:Arfaptin-1 [Eumeta japonica]